MKKERPFDVAKPRTSRGEARAREELMMKKMEELLSESTEASFKEKLEKTFGIRGIYLTPPDTTGCGLIKSANGTGPTCTAC